MKESVGYTVTLNIVITFIIIVFTFLSAALIYLKSNKVSKSITEIVEKYEGYNDVAKNDIQNKLSSIGYNKKNVSCERYYNRINVNERNNKCKLELNHKNNNYGLTDGSEGYCVFMCRERIPVSEDGSKVEWYYYYKISTNLMLNIPIINNLLDIPIFSNTNRLYDFESNLK